LLTLGLLNQADSPTVGGGLGTLTERSSPASVARRQGPQALECVLLINALIRKTRSAPCISLNKVRPTLLKGLAIRRRVGEDESPMPLRFTGQVPSGGPSNR
jgi:hypothetical protein